MSFFRNLTLFYVSYSRKALKVTSTSEHDILLSYNYRRAITVDGLPKTQWNALPASVKSRPSIHSFRCAIHSALTNSI